MWILKINMSFETSFIVLFPFWWEGIFDIQKISFRSPNKLLFCEILNESILSTARFFNNQYIALKLSIDGILFAYHWPSKTMFLVFFVIIFLLSQTKSSFFWEGKLSVGSSKPNGIRTSAHLNFGPYFRRAVIWECAFNIMRTVYGAQLVHWRSTAFLS